MIRGCIVVLFVLFGVFAPCSANAASKEEVDTIIAKVQAHPKKVMFGGYYYVDLPRTSPQRGVLRILVRDKPGGVHQFGIKAEYVVTAQEANYNMDTECDAVLSSVEGNGVVDNVQWDCIAWTPFMEKFAEDNGQRVFDTFMREAKVLLK